VKLPNYERALISQAKIKGYLLSVTHRDGRSKAKFFTQLGFSIDAWQELAAALMHHAADHEVGKIEDSPFGTRYIVEGLLHGPNARTAVIRSVWFIEIGEDVPQFVTAYPLQRRVR